MAALLGVLTASVLVPAGPVWAEESIPGHVSLEDSASHDSVELTWSEPATGSATEYRVVRHSLHYYRGKDSATKSVTVTARSYSDNDVLPSRWYWYSVTPVNAAGAGPTTQTQHFQIPVHAQSLRGPDNVRELSSGETQVTIEWDAVDGATGYEVTRVWKKGKLVISWETTYIQVSADRTRFVDTGVERRAQYLYWVRTENRHGVGEKSPGAVNAQAGDPPSTSELAPSNLTAELLDRRVSLAWDAPAWDAASVTHYRIQRRPVGGRIDRTAYTRNADTAYVDATANEPGVRYAYWVKAIRGEKASAGSNEVEVDIPPDPCSEPGQANGEAPTPVEVEVTGVPIVVESSTDEYFVLYASHDFDGTEVEIPVSVTLGEAGTTTLSENVAMLPKERYRVQRYTVAHPADVDGDCVDDITELNDLGTMNPVNSARTIETTDGAVAIPDHAAFETMSYWDGPGRPMYMDFVIFHIDTDRPQVYFINSTNDMARLGWHLGFVEAIGLGSIWPQTVTGGIVYDPKLATPGGSPGSYYFQFSGGRRFLTSNAMLMVYTALAANMPVLEDNLALYWPNDDLWHLQSRLPALRDSRVPLVFEQDLLAEVDFLALNPGEGYGRLRVMDPDDRPHPYDIVVYEALPNELPRVAGIVSAVPQTPLSHVNLRAVQDGLPNAFIRNAAELDEIAGLVGSYVHYAVTETGWTLRAATPEEVEAHYASSRPGEEQAPERDLTITSITPLSDIGFEDWDAFGVKAANVAVLGTLGFPDGTVPDGFAVPFYFYDEFMKHNELYDYIDEMLADPDFQTDFDTQASDLKKLRKKIKKGKTLDWMIEALQTMHATYPEGQSLRYRSSTNNEDLPGFNGAGLYDSKTQHPEETEEDGIAKSLKQVFASLWNFRAFTEREFHRIDHRAAAMGVLVHPNYSDELANGVAASFDPIQNWEGRYYVNTQVGEDMVTNPDAHSVPEEILLSQGGGLWRVLGTSNQAPPGQLLMSEDQMVLLGRYLEAIHERFKELYGVEEGERFAMEIEFEITSGNVLAIKQARPWVFSPARRPMAGGVELQPARHRRAGRHRRCAGRGDPRRRHIWHRRRGRVGERQLQLPVAGRRYRDRGGHRHRLHLDRGRRGQGRQGAGELHRRRGQRGVPDQRADGGGGGHHAGRAAARERSPWRYGGIGRSLGGPGFRRGFAGNRVPGAVETGIGELGQPYRRVRIHGDRHVVHHHRPGLRRRIRRAGHGGKRRR